MKKRSRYKKALMAWGIVLLFLVIVALLPSVFASHDPEASDMANQLCSPCKETPLGTDHMGRCVMCRLIYGARVSLFVSGAVVLITATFGTLVGLISGYFGGKIDSVLMRIVDVFLAFPSFLFTLAFVGIFGGGTRNLIIVMSFFGWMRYARVVRSNVLSVRENEYILASRGMGASNIYNIVKHVFPNVIGSVIVIITMEVGSVILSTSGLSFLGVGVQPPTPEWGYMLNDAKVYLSTKPELMLYPGLAILITILAFNFFGDNLRDFLDVKDTNFGGDK